MNSINKKIFQLLFVCLFFCHTISLFAQININDSIFIEHFYIDSMPLRTCLNTYYVMFTSNQFDTINSSCMNKEAIFLYRDRLNKLKTLKIENYIQDIYYCNFLYMTGLGYGFLDEDDNVIILQSEIDAWENWLIYNKDRICWFKERNLIYIRKE